MTVLGLTIGVLVLSTVLVPIVGEAQKNAGEIVTYTNPIDSKNPYHYDYVDSLELVATDHTSSRNFNTYTVNGQIITAISDYMLAVLSDDFALQIGPNGEFAPSYATDPFTNPPTITSQNTLTLTFQNHVWTLTGDVTGEIASGHYDWVVTYKDDGSFIARNGNPTNFYNSGDMKDFILYSGNYTSGEFDTFYAYGGGELSIGVQSYEGSINVINNRLVDGTTDVYQIGVVNLTITDGESIETFTPYRALVKETIIGHEDKGAAYSIYAVIPVLMIVALMVYAVSVIRNRD